MRAPRDPFDPNITDEANEGSGPRDEAVQATHVDAALAKISCGRLGYFEDKWTEQLVRNTRPYPRSPLIHRGYYSRVSAMRRTVMRFMERCPVGGGVQIVNLGAGVDSLYFWLRDSPDRWREDLVYFEVDFPEVLSKKLTAILRKQSLWPMLDASSQEDLVSSENGVSGTRELRTKHCRFVSTDMRVLPELEDAVIAAGFQNDRPTIFLSECVMVYMQAIHGDSIIQWASSAVSGAPSAMVVYEQFNPHDPFGKVMVENLTSRGCPLLSIFDYPTLDSQSERYLQRGWEKCWLADMNQIYSRHLDEKDVERIHKLEMMDEFEEWHLIQNHYFQLIATRSGSAGQSDDKEVLPAAGGEPDNSWIHEIVPASVAAGGVVPSGGYGGPSAPAVTCIQPRSGQI